MDEAQGRGSAQDGEAAAGHDRAEVGGFYDRFTKLTIGNTPGANLHYGYWTSPDDAATFEEAAAQLTALMIQKVRLPASGHLLDVGCGIGGPAVQLARVTGAEVTGITVSHEQVTLANELAAGLDLGDRVRFEYADAMKLPYPGGSFDASWLLESIIHMPDRGHVLGEIARVVRPGGRVVFTDLCERSPLTADEQSTVDEFFQAAKMSPMVTLDSYPRLVREAGLVLDEVLDISDNVMWRTTQELSRQMREARAEIDEKFATDPAYHLDPARLSDITALGYVLVVAHRPEA
ncbi:methyltransferase domain-containing protein [Streptomyces pactum]|uniref:methyltransferase domain-containing protein n=1 Tax=Streptomyces pactum TaxID=68249 RepID=UPI0006E3C14F|nr:methyltransferase domain-containing protein [Streptomyces pactum]